MPAQGLHSPSFPTFLLPENGQNRSWLDLGSPWSWRSGSGADIAFAAIEFNLCNGNEFPHSARSSAAQQAEPDDMLNAEFAVRHCQAAIIKMLPHLQAIPVRRILRPPAIPGGLTGGLYRRMTDQPPDNKKSL